MKKSQFRIAEMLTYEQVFIGKPLSTLEYVKLIGKENVLTLASYFINCDVMKLQNNPIQFIYDFFTQENSGFVNRLLKVLENRFGPNFSSSPISTLNFVNNISLYHIIETALSINTLPNASNQILSKDKLYFFKMFLAENSLHVSRQTPLYPNEFKSIEDAIGVTTACQIADWDYTHAKYSMVCITQMLKCVSFFNFLEQNLVGHLNLFYERNNLKSWKEYARCISNLILPLIKESRGGIIQVPNNYVDYNLVVSILDKLSSEKYEEKDDFDFTRLRNQPLYKMCDDSYLILSKLFLAEKLFNSLYFEFKEINDSLGDDLHIDNFKSYIGTHFTEEYLCNFILFNSFPNRCVKKTGSMYRAEGFNDSEPDFYARINNKAFLFECKDALFKSSAKVSYNLDMIINEISEKLYYTKNEKGKKKKKAILQLIRNSERLLTESNIDKNVNTQKVKIFPIVVVQDKTFCTPGVNWIVNKWFKEELKINYPNLLPHMSSIYIIDIDTLLLIRHRLQSRKIILEHILDNYHKHMLSNDKEINQLSLTDYAYGKLFEQGSDVKGILEDLKVLIQE